MLAKNRPLKSEDTSIMISVNERGQDALIKRFDDTNVDWSVIERQLVAWSELFRAGRKLTVKISFNYRRIEFWHFGSSSRTVDTDIFFSLYQSKWIALSHTPLFQYFETQG
jgi:hypothetical protein